MIQLDVRMPRLFAEGTSELRVQLAIESRSLSALVGPSGSGKTTLLRLLAGLETPKTGRISVNDDLWLDTGQAINRPPQQRSIGYVFQDTALFPNMTVRENIRYAALRGEQNLVSELMEATGLDSFAEQTPVRLSGGQRQRVALARALVRRPQLLLLDEPFAALDAEAGQHLQRVLLDLHQRWKTTTLLVSHHEADVRALADRVIRLVAGRVQSDLTAPEHVFSHELREVITQIAYDETRQVWQVETSRTHLQSSNPAWGHYKVGDLVWVAGNTGPK